MQPKQVGYAQCLESINQTLDCFSEMEPRAGFEPATYSFLVLMQYKAIAFGFALPAELSGLILPFPHVLETLKGLMLKLVLFLFF